MYNRLTKNGLSHHDSGESLIPRLSVWCACGGHGGVIAGVGRDGFDNESSVCVCEGTQPIGDGDKSTCSEQGEGSVVGGLSGRLFREREGELLDEARVDGVLGSGDDAQEIGGE